MSARERVGGPGTTPQRVAATVRLLRHHRAFLASPCREMRDPTQWGVYLTKPQVERRLTMWLHAAINRRAGVPDFPVCNARWQAEHGGPRVPRAYDQDYQRGLGQDARRLNRPRLRIGTRELATPALRRRFAARLSDD